MYVRGSAALLELWLASGWSGAAAKASSAGLGCVPGLAGQREQGAIKGSLLVNNLSAGERPSRALGWRESAVSAGRAGTRGASWAAREHQPPYSSPREFFPIN